MEKLEVGDCSDDVAMTTFTNKLKDKDPMRSLYPKPPEDFEDIMNQVKTYILANEALRSFEDKVRDLSSKQSKRSK